ncbi:hypothetical protein AC249_AIPGENE22615 [Exaiptasia diaphana]|nr:hypothetical protein AC249_AIPGENE22615 [Exaiptasia diaphana]
MIFTERRNKFCNITLEQVNSSQHFILVIHMITAYHCRLMEREKNQLLPQIVVSMNDVKGIDNSPLMMIQETILVLEPLEIESASDCVSKFLKLPCDNAFGARGFKGPHQLDGEKAVRHPRDAHIVSTRKDCGTSENLEKSNILLTPPKLLKRRPRASESIRLKESSNPQTASEEFTRKSVSPTLKFSRSTSPIITKDDDIFQFASSSSFPQCVYHNNEDAGNVHGGKQNENSQLRSPRKRMEFEMKNNELI